MVEEARRRRLSRQAQSADEISGAAFDDAAEAREAELAADLERARAKITGLERRAAQEGAAARALSEQMREMAAQSETAAQRIAELENDLGAARDERDLRSRENQSLRTSLDAAAADNARMSQRLGENDTALAAARARCEYLESALAAAEGECSRLRVEASTANERRTADCSAMASRLEAMSGRATTAEKLYADARDRLAARIAEHEAAERLLAEATAACAAADRRLQELQGTLQSRQRYIEELEQCRADLIEATKTLLKTVRSRDAAVVRAAETIKSLSARVVRLEADLSLAKRQRPAAKRDAPAQPDVTPPAAGDESGETARKKWAELASELTKLVHAKRQSAGAAPALLAGTAAA